MKRWYAVYFIVTLALCVGGLVELDRVTDKLMADLGDKSQDVQSRDTAPSENQVPSPVPPKKSEVPEQATSDPIAETVSPDPGERGRVVINLSPDSAANLEWRAAVESGRCLASPLANGGIHLSCDAVVARR
jgi:hypothetical protein